MSRPVGRGGVLLALLLACATLAGCASVPDSSPVQVLRRVTDGDTAILPPGPVDGANPLDLVRGFVNASGSSADGHGAARRFLAPEADWDDAAGITVMDGLFNTVYSEDLPAAGVDVTSVRVRGTGIGRLGGDGAFAPDRFPVEIDLDLARSDGQWRISALPDGVVVTLSDFRINYRTVRVHFVDPARGTVVGDLRHLPGVPARAQAARAMDMLLAGPSAALRGAAVTRLPVGTRLRSNVAESPDGALIVDLTEVGELDQESRRLIAAQVVFTLAEVNVGRVRLLVDGVPLLPDQPDLTRDSDLTRDDGVDLAGDRASGSDVAALAATDGAVLRAGGPELGARLPGPVGDGTFNVESAAINPAGDRLALVTQAEDQRTLQVGSGTGGGFAAVGVTAATMTRPCWGPGGTEVWTALDGASVARVGVVDGVPTRLSDVDAAELTALGPVQELRLSADGLRVAAVVGGVLHVAAVARRLDGEVVLRNVLRLRPADLGEVVGVDWAGTDRLVVIGRRGDRPVSLVAVDGLTVAPVSPSNLTPPLTAVAAAPGRPLLVTDQVGVWSFAGGDLDTWRLVLGGVPAAVPFYPG